MQKSRYDTKKNKELTYTPMISDTHDAVKAYATFNRMRIPEAYAKIIAEGLSALGFNYKNFITKKWPKERY